MNNTLKIFHEHRLFPCSFFTDAASVWSELHTSGQVVNHYRGQVKEVFEIRHPHLAKGSEEYTAALRDYLQENDTAEKGVWVWYPWRKTLVRTLEENDFIELRTSRNQLKVKRQEQEELRNKCVCIIGLSVGQSVAVTMAMERSVGCLRLVDFDTLDLSNLNRLRAGLHELGEPKTRIAARAIASFDPYIKIELAEQGAQPDNLQHLLDGTDLLLEECDSLPIKILARLEARRRGIPVIMDTSDRGLLDVERFDQEGDRLLFHGLAGDIDAAVLDKLNAQTGMQLMMQLMEYPKLSERLQESYAEMGKTLTTWPQLASEVAAGGAHAAEAARRILLGQFMPSGRYRIEIPLESAPT